MPDRLIPTRRIGGLIVARLLFLSICLPVLTACSTISYYEQAVRGHGLYLRGVLLFFAALLTRHAVNIHNTLVREIQLENESRQLARSIQLQQQRLQL